MAASKSWITVISVALTVVIVSLGEAEVSSALTLDVAPRRSLLSGKSKGKSKGRSRSRGRRPNPPRNVPVRVRNPPARRPQPVQNPPVFPSQPVPRQTFPSGPSFAPTFPSGGFPNPVPSNGFGSAVGTATGFVVVYVLADGRRCFIRSTGFIDTSIRRMGAGTFIEQFGTLEGSAQCAAGAKGVGIAVLTSQAFAEVVRVGRECRTRGGSSGQASSNVFGTGIQVGVSGGLGFRASCPQNKG